MAFIPVGSGYDNRAFDTKRAKPLRRKCVRCDRLLQISQRLYCKPCSMDVADVNRARWAASRKAAKLAAREARLTSAMPEANRTNGVETEVAKDWKCEDALGECEWPLCGCDPDASKVIAAIEEAFTLTPKVGRQRLQEPSPTPDAAFLLP